MMPNELLDAALAYAKAGHPVGPLHTPILDQPCACTAEQIAASPKSHGYAKVAGRHVGCSCASPGPCKHDQPGKHPRTQNGHDDFTVDEDTIRAWWKKWPKANVGMRLDFCDTLDIDQPGRVPDAVRAALPPAGKVPCSTTGRGSHYLFDKQEPSMAPPAALSFGEYKTTGYIAVEPSLHPSGARYRWTTSIIDAAPKAMTMKLRDALLKARRKPRSARDERTPEQLLDVALAALAELGIPAHEHEDGWRSVCPVHGLDGQAHAADTLSLRAGDVALLLHCFAGCPYGAVAAKLGVLGEPDVREARQQWLDAQPSEDLAQLLDDIVALIRRFWVASEEAYTAVALWVVHCWVFDRADMTPRLHIRSAVFRSGKTRTYEVIGPLLPGAGTVDVLTSAASLYRDAGIGEPFLFDEVDQWVDSTSEAGKAITAIVNAGYERGAFVRRQEPDGDGGFITVKYPVFVPVAFSGLGRITDTTADRSIPIVLERRTASEPIERFRKRRYAEEANRLAERIEIWRHQNMERLDAHLAVDLPPIGGVSDRSEDVWVILLALAELAAGDWPDRARDTARVLHTTGAQDESDQEHLELLAHAREVFVAEGMPTSIASADLRTKLVDGEEWPWREYGRTGKAVSLHRIASLLRRFGVRTGRVYVHSDSEKPRYGPWSWWRADLEDAWERYLGPLESDRSDRSDRPDRTAGQEADSALSDPVTAGSESDRNGDGAEEGLSDPPRSEIGSDSTTQGRDQEVCPVCPVCPICPDGGSETGPCTHILDASEEPL